MRKRHSAGKTAESTRQQEPGLDLSSLIDVSFLLLIFFLVTSSLDPREADLGLNLPKTNGPGIVDIDRPIIEIKADGAITYGEEEVEQASDQRFLPVLRDKLVMFKQVAHATGQKPVVIIDADDSARGQRFIDVMNCLADVGIENIFMAQSPQE